MIDWWPMLTLGLVVGFIVGFLVADLTKEKRMKKDREIEDIVRDALEKDI
ncbi:MAG: hypothetical protein ABSG42_09460 [Nitrospirota bacterium]